ncbi:hypothetical protein [Treponema endosymbiont of Eucomonympha sp.]|nr:hypothetical protein [Treponema endosymbiont of Eucomonympha sp.]
MKRVKSGDMPSLLFMPKHSEHNKAGHEDGGIIAARLFPLQ